MQYLWDQQYPLESIVTRARGVGVAGGGSDASVYSVNWRCNSVVRVVAVQSSAVSVAFVVDNVPTAWRSAVVAVARFASAWACVYCICYWTAVFACQVAAHIWA